VSRFLRLIPKTSSSGRAIFCLLISTHSLTAGLNGYVLWHVQDAHLIGEALHVRLLEIFLADSFLIVSVPAPDGSTIPPEAKHQHRDCQNGETDLG
jgi:hypothetical protein